MFWCTWPEVEITDNSVFDLYFDPRNGKYDHDRNENHVFLNSCNGIESYYNGLVLFSKNKPISKREFDVRYLIDKKEHSQIASKYQYPIYTINTYKEYQTIIELETQPMFWCTWPEVEITDNSVFDLYFDPRDGKYDHDRNENHVFKHLFRNEETYNNGIVLFSQRKLVSEKEFNFRYLIDKKEHDIIASKLTPYDIVFISYDESNADENYQKILERFPTAKRIHGIKGIHQAHIEAAKNVETEMFWVVDADAIIESSFKFDHEVSRYDLDVVHVWQSCNPINNLVYGYGGVKLLPKNLTIDMDISKPDMTTSISTKFKAMESVSNITAFNTDEFSTWKSAFRECVKLASRTISGQDNAETQQRLEIWKTVGADKLYGKYAIQGAADGEEYGFMYKDNPESLRRINDFDWLKEYYEQRTKNIHP
jgi:hypothetical protein